MTQHYINYVLEQLQLGKLSHQLKTGQMKKIIKILAFISVLFVIACKPTSHIGKTETLVNTKDTVSIKEYVTKVDTFYSVPADSAKSIIYINCDSLNNPVISEGFTDQGKGIKMNYHFKDDIDISKTKKNQKIPLYVNCKIDSSMVAFSYFNTHQEIFRSHLQDSTNTITVIQYIEKKLSKWNSFLLIIGKYTFWFLIFLLVGLIVYITLKILKYI